MNNYVSSDEWRGASRSRFGVSFGNRRGVLCKSNFNNIFKGGLGGSVKGNTRQKGVIVVVSLSVNRCVRVFYLFLLIGFLLGIGGI